jgi:hypothetical protein
LPVADAWSLPVKSVTVKVTEGEHDTATLDRLAALVAAHPGKAPLRLVIDTAEGMRVMMEADRHSVAWSPALQAGLVELLGPGSVRAAVTFGGRRKEAPARGGYRGSGANRPVGV